jgi:hypothetical protein
LDVIKVQIVLIKKKNPSGKKEGVGTGRDEQKQAISLSRAAQKQTSK